MQELHCQTKLAEAWSLVSYHQGKTLIAYLIFISGRRHKKYPKTVMKQNICWHSTVHLHLFPKSWGGQQLFSDHNTPSIIFIRMVNRWEGKIPFLALCKLVKQDVAKYPWQHCWCAAKKEKRHQVLEPLKSAESACLCFYENLTLLTSCFVFFSRGNVIYTCM